MVKITRRVRMIREKIDTNRLYDANKAFELLKDLSTVNFIESVDVAINLNIDTRKSNQNIRGAIVLPHGTGRSVRIAVFAQGLDIEAAKLAGADMVGMDDLAEYIKKNKIDFDIVIASPDAMHIVSQLSQILGPLGLMPNLKVGTITPDIANVVKNIKEGQIHYHNDKNGIIHSTIGKVDFETNKLKENLESLVSVLKKTKPVQIKGVFINKISVSSTMGVAIVIDPTTISTTKS